MNDLESGLGGIGMQRDFSFFNLPVLTSSAFPHTVYVNLTLHDVLIAPTQRGMVRSVSAISLGTETMGP